ncbi:MAG: flagellar hook-associated protein 3 [Treponema sp.]|nr:flagellar hook-associated protein 3 [Treponema sp.]
MQRISTSMPFENARFNLMQQQSRISNLQNQITGENRIQELRDDPLAAARAVRYESFATRLQRFEQNTLYAQDHFNLTYAHMDSALSIVQRVRELSVMAANGIYTQEDLRNMAIEVNEMLGELVSISNAVGPDGNQLFGGDRAFTEPFRIVEGLVEGGRENMIIRVDYRGAGASRNAEISEGTFVNLDLSGGEAFWAERMQIFSSVNATNYRVSEPGSFFLNGEEIAVTIGDTLPSIVARINDSAAPVIASIDPTTSGLVLRGTGPGYIRAEDGAQGATVLRDLGIIRGNMDTSVTLWDETRSTVSGGSAFDMMIRLRDAMFRGDHEFIGSQGVAGMDMALENMVTRIADIGSRQHRVEVTWNRLNREIPDLQSYIAREVGVNMATAATDLSMMELAHRASLQTTARLLPVSLLDFLR